MILFDSSAFINLIKKSMLEPLTNGYILDLTIYESINALWKECYLLKRISVDDTVEFLNIMINVFPYVNIMTIEGKEREVLKLSLKEGLTIYDASYLCLAEKHGFILVTDDRCLREIAKKYVVTLNTKDFLKHYR